MSVLIDAPNTLKPERGKEMRHMLEDWGEIHFLQSVGHRVFVE